MSGLSIIIPVYNENVDTVENLITVLRNASNVIEIILVDDGSHEKLSIKYKTIKGVVYIRHPINKGKTIACFTGYKKSRGSYIAFIDADIHGISTKEIEALSPLMKRFSVFRLYRGGATGIRKLFGIPYIIGGEIILSRQLLETYKSYIFNGPRWQLEYRINDIMIKHMKQSCMVYVPRMEHTMKWDKKWPIQEYIRVEWGAFVDCFITNGGIMRFLYYQFMLRSLIKKQIILA